MYARSTLVALFGCSLLLGCDTTAPREPLLASQSTRVDEQAQLRGEEVEHQGDAAASKDEHTSAGTHADAQQGSALTTQSTQQASAIRPDTAQARLDYEQNTIDVFRTVAPATVFVTQNQLVRDRWSRRALEVPTGSGSGIVWDRLGHIVTNAHVVASGNPRTSYSVTLYDGKSYDAELVGRDDQKDLAVLKVKAPSGSLHPIRLPLEKARPEVGQKALAIGNPFGLDHTLTVGVVSALDREVRGFGNVTIRGMIQTDASINPGNSGGPLLDAAGELLGLNTIIFSKSGSSAGIGFAVPVNIIRRIVPQIIKYGEPVRTGLGVTLVSDELAQANGIRGVVVESVAPRSGAARAGLRGLQRTRRGVLLGDVIVGIDSKKVDNFDDLYTVLDEHQPGDTVQVVVQRDNKRVSVPVTLMRIAGHSE